MATPYSLMVLEEVPSTQDAALAQARAEGCPAVVVAGRQTQGRGRLGAEWDTAPRAVAVSVAFDSTSTGPVSLTAGVAARRVLGDGVDLKWPNDVLIDDAKVAGILVEGHGDVTVAGLGVNLYWPGAPAGRTGLYPGEPEDGQGVEVSEQWASQLLALLAEPVWPRDEYLAACVTLGRDVTWDGGGHGRAIDVAADGGLVVLTDTGEVTLHSGEVRHVRSR